MKRVLGIVFAVALGTLLALPWVLYEIGLGNINGRPVPSENQKLTDAEAEKLWTELKEVGSIKLVKLDPYRYIMPLFGFYGTALSPGEKLAWFVARNHNATNLNDKRNIYWHLSGASLTIWLTRNWSIEQLLAKAREIQQITPASNTVLEPTR